MSRKKLHEIVKLSLECVIDKIPLPLHRNHFSKGSIQSHREFETLESECKLLYFFLLKLTFLGKFLANKG